MKGRATAMAVVTPPVFSDWGEESWTVDCPCGVNFDDGEEMVDCDECGVWVHTSCCHVLKGHTSYVCDRCRSRKKKEAVVETEVAQLLLDLPSKTPPLEDCPGVAFRSRTERAHVQGIPGGDASFFVGVSKVFSPQLWKCTGYVPKVLNMNYTDLPPWPKEKEGVVSLFADIEEQQVGNPVSVELRKELFHEPVDVFIEDPLPCLEKHMKREGGRKVDSRHGNDQNRVHTAREDKGHCHSSRRKREAKVLSGEKRAVGTRGVEGTRNKAPGTTEDGSFSFKYTCASPNSLKTVSKITIQNYRDEDAKISNEYTKVDLPLTHEHGETIEGSVTSNEDCNKPHGKLKNEKKSCAVKIGGNACIMVIKSRDQAKQLEKQSSPEGTSFSNRHVGGHLEQGPGTVKLHQEQSFPSQKLQFSSLVDETQSMQLTRDYEKQPVTELSDCGAPGQSSEKCFDHAQGKIGTSAHWNLSSVAHILQPSIEERFCELQVPEENCDNLICEQKSGLGELTGQEKAQKLNEQDHSVSHLLLPSFQGDADANVSDFTFLAALNAQSQDGGSLHASCSMAVQTVPVKPLNSCSSTLPSIVIKPREELTHSNCVSPLFDKMDSAVLVNNIMPTDASMPVSGQLSAATIKPCVSSEKKSVSTFKSVKAKSKSKAVMESSDSGYTPAKPLTATGTTDGTVWHSNEGEPLVKHSAKESASISGHASSKATALSKPLSLSVTSKHPVHLGSSKNTGLTSLKQDTDFRPTTPEQTCQIQSDDQPCFSPTKQDLNIATVKSEKMDEPCMQMISKALPIRLPLHPLVVSEKEITNSTAHDEELALLLHQALNSSPRVPRVARVRQHVTSSQLVSPSQTSLKHPLAVAASTSTVTSQKDHNLAPRRVVRDESSRESLHGTLILAEDIFKGGSCVIGNHEDKLLTGDTKDEMNTGGELRLVTVSPTNEGSNQPLLLPVDLECQSPNDMPSANNYADGGERKHSSEIMVTLPGLIEEILHGHCHQISYEHICEAVLPHWPKLRKPNGERYAYTSHRQAVLDCLRNRSAWSHLVERGPKTNLGRKRRRSESITAIEFEYDDNADCKMSAQDDFLDNAKLGKACKNTDADNSDCGKPRNDDISISEDVPRGKRNGRKRRSLTLQPKGDGSFCEKKDKVKYHMSANVADHDPVPSTLSEEAASDNSEDEDDFLVHRGFWNMSRRQWSNVDSEDDANL